MHFTKNAFSSYLIQSIIILHPYHSTHHYPKFSCILLFGTPFILTPIPLPPTNQNQFKTHLEQSGTYFYNSNTPIHLHFFTLSFFFSKKQTTGSYKPVIRLFNLLFSYFLCFCFHSIIC